MTETKRFKLGYACGDYGLIDNKEWVDDFHSMSENGEKNVQICINKMNELADENKQLKQFKSKVLKLLDEKIKHYEHKPFSAPVGQPMSVNFDADMDRIARLSELQHLRKELG